MGKAGTILALSAAGLGGALVLGKRKPSSSSSSLPQWEREALAGGQVGEPEGDHPELDAAPSGDGTPGEHCLTLGAGSDGESGAWCVTDPLGAPRFAPIGRGAAMAGFPSSSTWPVLTKHRSRLVVSYWTQAGVQGYSGRAFGAKRVDAKDGATRRRRHAGVDLFAREGDVVVAPEDARVLRVLPFFQGTWAVYLRSPLGERVLNLGELARNSWREFDVRPGQLVLEGQPLGRIGLQAKGSVMLHFETYGVAGVSDEELIAAIRAGALRWMADAPAPTWLHDPSAYLITAATRTYRRAQLLGGS